MMTSPDSNYSGQQVDREKTERDAITAFRHLQNLQKQAPPERATAVRTGEDIASISEMLAERATAAGRYAKEHGEYIEGLCTAFAKAQREQRQAYASKLMAAETKKQEELKRLLGGQT